MVSVEVHRLARVQAVRRMVVFVVARQWAVVSAERRRWVAGFLVGVRRWVVGSLVAEHRLPRLHRPHD